jgi:hypothetical protein
MKDNNNGEVMDMDLPRHRVRFNLLKNRVHCVKVAQIIGDKEVSIRWYQKQDFVAIRQDLIPILRKMMKNAPVVETSRVTTRGLEHRTQRGAIRRAYYKSEALHRVLEEQELQRLFREYRDEDRLARVYRSITEHCQRHAHELALTDVAPAVEFCSGITIDTIRNLHIKESTAKFTDSEPMTGKRRGLFKTLSLLHKGSDNPKRTSTKSLRRIIVAGSAA